MTDIITKKLAFCFLIYDSMNHEELWNSWFQNVCKSKYDIYIHYKTNKPLKYFEKYKLENCIETQYCHVSIVHAHNLLFKEAYDNGCYKIISLSQSCVPLKSFDYVYDFLTKDNLGYFNIVPNQIGVYPRCNHLLNYYDRYDIQKSSNWFILNRDIIECIVYKSKTELNNEWSKIYCPEEHYFITMIFHNKLVAQIIITPNIAAGATTFVNWSNMDYPFQNHRGLKNYSVITDKEINYLLGSSCLFGRKFNPKCIVNTNKISLLGRDIYISSIINPNKISLYDYLKTRI